MGLFRAGLDVDGLLDQICDGRGFEDEGEGAVLEDGDEGGDDLAALVFGFGVVLVDELHDVDTMLTKGGTDGRSGVGGSGGENQFEYDFDFFGGHVFIV